MASDLSRSERALLFRAAFAASEEAREAWDRFCRARALDDLYPSASSIMPALYLNLEREGIRGEWIDRIKGYYRYTWCRNQLAFRRLETLLERLAAEGIRPIAIGTLGSLLALGLTRAERSLHSLELLVSARDKERAARTTMELARLFGEDGKDPRPIITSSPWAGSEEAWRSTAVAARIGQSSILVPRAEDLLLDALVRASRTGDDSWLIDAALVLSARGNIVDWSAFGAAATERMSVLAARRSLLSLGGLRPGLVPERVMEEIGRLRAHPFERLPVRLSGAAWRVVSPLRRAASRLRSAMSPGRRARQ